MSIFNGSKLLISARSPFARRVRIAFLEHSISFEEVVMNVFEHNPLLNKHNPLRRVPTIVLASGEEIVDSHSILNVFYDEKRSSTFMPQTRQQKIICENWSGIAIGVCESTVQYFLETQKPTTAQDVSWIKEILDIVGDSLTKYEKFLGHKKYCLDSQLTQTDIDWGTTLAYLQLRIPAAFTAAKYPKLYEYVTSLNERDSFRKTVPPA